MSEQQSDECWRTVVGSADYEVSDKGRVRSLKSGHARLSRPAKQRGGYITSTPTTQPTTEQPKDQQQ